jgi:hypothetical protein
MLLFYSTFKANINYLPSKTSSAQNGNENKFKRINRKGKSVDTVALIPVQKVESQAATSCVALRLSSNYVDTVF